MLALWLAAGILAGPAETEKPVYVGGWFGETAKQKPARRDQKPKRALAVVEQALSEVVVNTALAEALAKAAEQARLREDRELAAQERAPDAEDARRAADALLQQAVKRTEAEQDSALSALNAALIERAAIEIEVEALKAAQAEQDADDFLILAMMASF